ncbi:MAG TPA: GNAT family N-acetyltransferase [Caulobacteraceae bacterium]|jgi:ribosomal protein S18 acetylase RimI-like enzyme
MTFTIEERRAGSGAICRAILATIEPWFGLPASNAEYEGLAETGPAVVALQDGEPVGLMLLQRHFDTALEIYFIGVDGSRHRQGAGRALIAHAEAIARAEGRRFVTLKTRGPSLPYEPTSARGASTRRWATRRSRSGPTSGARRTRR